ncbi:hypothetical protein J6590_029828 [Homalodisca vitripennis]|nr:hypothetical protein J6590_029828 [Homalodisca vitripennis]
MHGKLQELVIGQRGTPGGNGPSMVFGVSTQCRPLGLSCLSKVEKIIKENGLPDVSNYVLPMKLPHRCVTQRQCFIPNSVSQFHKALGLPGPIHPL